MKIIKVDYKVSRGSAPEWLLGFISSVRIYFDTASNGEENYRLRSISEYLDTRNYYHRKLKRSCNSIRRDIDGEILKVYNVSGTKILVEISYEPQTTKNKQLK